MLPLGKHDLYIAIILNILSQHKLNDDCQNVSIRKGSSEDCTVFLGIELSVINWLGNAIKNREIRLLFARFVTQFTL
jgi:hypothetical protein